QIPTMRSRNASRVPSPTHSPRSSAPSSAIHHLFQQHHHGRTMSTDATVSLPVATAVSSGGSLSTHGGISSSGSSSSGSSSTVNAMGVAPPRPSGWTLQDLEIIRLLGEGNFGRVMLVRRRAPDPSASSLATGTMHSISENDGENPEAMISGSGAD